MIKITLTSTDKELRKQLNSNSFRDANYIVDYGDDGKDYKTYLKLVHNPVVGDYLYFYGNYYEQYSVVVTRISYDISGNMLVWCSKCLLSDIDPYIYKGNTYSDDFKNDILSTYKKLIKNNRIKKTWENEINQYGSGNYLQFIAYELDEYLGIDKNSVIDHMNIWYLIKDILSKAYPDKYEWHRPERWEYSDM